MPADARRFRSADGFECFLTRDAVDRLLNGTIGARPDEAFALLFGRSFHDAAGEYTVVNGVHYPASATRGPGHVHLTPAEAAAARTEGARLFPVEDPVGWSHSHGRHSDYSATDREEQRTWPGHHHVGILTFMSGPPWLRLYHGPQAVPMEEAGRPADGVAPPRLGQWAAAVPAVAEAPALAPRRRLGVAVAVACALALLALTGATLALAMVVSPPAPVAATDFHCAPPAAVAPAVVQCRGPVGAGIVGWDWTFAGEDHQTAPDASHLFLAAGRYPVHLVVRTERGTVDAGTAQIDVRARPAPTFPPPAPEPSLRTGSPPR